MQTRLPLLIAAFLLPCCSTIASRGAPNPVDTAPAPADVELVMPVGSTLSVKGRNGPISVTAVSWNERRYSWRGLSFTSKLDPRPRRWYGSLGIFGLLQGSDRVIGSADGQPVVGSLDSNGFLASVSFIEEHQLHWHSMAALVSSYRTANEDYDEAQRRLGGECSAAADVGACLNSARSVAGPTLWNATGLNVTLSVQEFKYQGSPVKVLTSYVIQDCIGGRKPARLPGATPGLALRDAKGKPIDSLPCKNVGDDADIDTWKTLHPDQY